MWQIHTQWVDTDTMQIRSRVVAREFKSGDRPDLCTGAPPLEALNAIISIAASHSPEFSLMHVDVSGACFHAKAQRPVLVTFPAEDCSGKHKGNFGLLKKSMYGTRDAASNWERDWQGHLENWGFELVRSSNVRSYRTQLHQIEAGRSVLFFKGERQWIQVFEFGNMSSEVTVFSDSDWAGDKETRKSSSAGGALVGRHVLKAYPRKQKIITRSRTVCSSIGSVRSEGGPEHDV